MKNNCIRRSRFALWVGFLHLIFLTPTAVQAATPMISTGAQSQHTCTLTSAGGVSCWGSNSNGQLGDGSTSARLTPVDVSGLASGVNSIAAGTAHVCALTSAGGVKCWGKNLYGQLGDGSITDRLTPADVSGLTSGVSAIMAGGNHTCAITNVGSVKCWGYNAQGQLGDGTKTQRLTPVDVSGLTSAVTAMAAGRRHTCALTSAGSVKCWGFNTWGQLGDGSSTSRLTPVDVLGLASGISAITAGDMYTCALTGAGGAKCWGDNVEGQLGDGSSAVRLTAVDVIGLASGTRAITAGYRHACALTSAGGMKCWGSNAYGQLGDGSTTSTPSAVNVSGLTSDISAITAGFGHTCALTNGGAVTCWGSNSDNQLGDGSNNGKRLTAVDVKGLGSGVSQIAAGAMHNCALASGGAVKCWGANIYGQLGDGSTAGGLTPVVVGGLVGGVSTMAAGDMYTCVLTSASGVKCWGENSLGQLGDGSAVQRSTPVDVSGLTSGVTAIAGGWATTCAVTSGGAVKCWGNNDWGQLGDGTYTQSLIPVPVVGLTGGVIAVEVSDSHSCALTGAGGVKCWGDNSTGQLGNGSTIDSPTPVDVVGLGGAAIAITNAYGHTCALISSGSVRCWGDNRLGAVGDGSTINRLLPVDVSGLTSGVSAIAAGTSHVCALTSGGGVKCWGGNNDGQLGDNSIINRLTPVDVVGLTSGVSAIAGGGGFHTCALTNSGAVKCWGNNIYGQSGDGTAGYRPLASLFVVGFGAASPLDLDLARGWNLVGNGTDQSLAVATMFGNPALFISVWKWDVASSGWQFYAPSMDAPTLQAYATGKNFGVLSVIGAGEGFWVNASQSNRMSLLGATPVASSSFSPVGVRPLALGWSLIATGDAPTPGTFNTSLSQTPPSLGTTPTNLTTLWAWDVVTSGWYFWAPSLVNAGTLNSYVSSKGYLDFSNLPSTPAGTISPGTGFWVNRP